MWETYNSQEAATGVRQDDTLTFQIPPSSSCTDIAESYIKITGYFDFPGNVSASDNAFDLTTEGDYDPNSHATVAPVPFLAAALLNDVTLDINGVSVIPSQGTAQPYAMIANIIKNEGHVEQLVGDETKGYTMDDWETRDVNIAAGANNLVTSNIGAYTRQLMYFGKKIPNTGSPTTSSPGLTFSLTYRLSDAGLRPTTGKWLPPNTSFRFRGRRSKDSFLIGGGSYEVSGNPAATPPIYGCLPIFKFTDAKMYVSRKTLDVDAYDGYMNSWQGVDDIPPTPMRFPFQAIKTFVHYCQQGTDISIVGALGGPTPKAVMAIPVPTKCLNGTNNGDTPLQHMRLEADYVWSNVTLSVGGARTYPVHPLTTKTGTYNDGATTWDAPGTYDLAEIYQMYRSICDGAPFLSSSQFHQIQPLCFQIGSRSDAMDFVDDVTIQFDGTISSATLGVKNSWALILIAFHNSILELDHTGETKVFY